MGDLTDLRLRLRANGYAPIPDKGKLSYLLDWPTKTDASEEEIASWEQKHPEWRNTGILCKNTPAGDIDIKDPDAAEAVHGLLIERFGERGTILTRYGEAPKRAVLFKTATPFTKIRQEYIAPSGAECAIEFLGNGQQVVVLGIHPDIKKPYSCHAGRSPLEVPRDDLPEINEAEARQFVKDATELLIREFNFDIVTEDDRDQTAIAAANKVPVDADAELAAIRPGRVNATYIRVVPSLLYRGIHPDEVLNRVVDATMAMVTKHGIKWSRDKEVTRVGRTVNSAIKNLLMRGYDPAAGCAPDWLHPEYHDQWLDVLATGHVPSLRRNAHVFFVSPGKQFAETAASDNSAPEPTNSAPEPTNPTPEPRKAKNPGVFVLPRTMPFDYGALEGLPWLYGDHYMRRTVSGTVAPGGTGKSSLTLGETIVMAWAQRAVLGELPLERMRVWYHSGEEPMEILKLRVAAFCIHHGIPLEEILPEWLILTTKSEFPFKVAEGYSDVKINDVLLKRMAQQIKERDVAIAVFDPLVKMHRIAEQDPGKMDQVASAFQDLAEDCNACVDLVHHTRKRPAGNGDYDFTADDIRGAGALKDAMRSVRILNQPTNAELATIPEHERKRFFRVSMVKANYSLTTRDTCYQLATVQIPNKQMTEMGAVELWNPPALGSPEVAATEQRAKEVFMNILNRVTLQGLPIASDRKGQNWAPRIFAEEAEAKSAGIGEKMLDYAMSQLIREGKVTAVDKGSGGRTVHKIVPKAATT